MTRKALIVGIDYYEHSRKISPLYGCVNDAMSVQTVLERHQNGKLNFVNPNVMLGKSPSKPVNKNDLRKAIKSLFAGSPDIALLYFAGHGHIESTGGYLIASDTESPEDGLALSDIMVWASKSEAKHKIILLDSCHSGIAGNPPGNKALAELPDGITILTASTEEQYATEKDGSGIFTSLLVDALNGAAANLVGDVSPGGLYAHIDQSLGPWEQRPVFKTNVTNFVSLRQTHPSIELEDLQQITSLFPVAKEEHALDPGYEPESDSPDPAKMEKFAVLQKYNRVNLVVPVGAPHMYFAAMNHKSCKLTPLGEHYRRLVEQNKI